MAFSIASITAISKIISNPAWDLLVLFFFFVFGFFYGISAGKKKMLAVLFSIYISVLLFTNFTFLDFFIQEKELLEVFLFRSASFLVMIVLLSILFSKTVFRGSDKKEAWWHAFVLSFLQVGLLVSAIFQLLPTKELFDFTPIIENIFASERSFFYWLTLPLLSLLFIVRKQKYER